MEDRKTVEERNSSSDSSSKISSDLFGVKESGNCSSSKPGIFSSVFPPASTVLGRSSLHSDALGSLRHPDSRANVGNTKHAHAGDLEKSSDGKSHSENNKELSSIYSDEAEHPCFLSSSLYYGGRDVFVRSSKTQGSETSSTNNQYGKDAEDDDPNSSNMASRGNWWQGSLYY